MILHARTLHALCFLAVDCGHIDFGFMVHLKRLLHIIWHFLVIWCTFSKKYILPASQECCSWCLCKVCSSLGQKWGYYGEKNYLAMSFKVGDYSLKIHKSAYHLCSVLISKRGFSSLQARKTFVEILSGNRHFLIPIIEAVMPHNWAYLLHQASQLYAKSIVYRI